MSKIYVISDVHGDRKALAKATQGIDFRKTVVFIGDLINACITPSVYDDLECLKYIEETCILIVGNHEIPYFDPSNNFHGFFRNSEVGRKLHEANENGRVIPSMVHGDTLITHAGITKPQLNFGTGTTAAEVNDKLHKEWYAGNYRHYLFSDIGHARGGSDAHGGILWCDWNSEFVPTEFPQIVGHTPGELRIKDNGVCIDTIAETGTPTVLHLEES